MENRVSEWLPIDSAPKDGTEQVMTFENWFKGKWNNPVYHEVALEAWNASRIAYRESEEVRGLVEALEVSLYRFKEILYMNAADEQVSDRISSHNIPLIDSALTKFNGSQS